MWAVIRFFALTFVLSWGCWGAVLTISRGHGDAPPTSVLQQILLMVGTFGPAIVAVVLTLLDQRRAGVVALLHRMLRWQVGLRWYLFAILFMPVIKLAAAVSHRLIAGAWPRFGHEGPLIIAIAMVFSTPVQSGEEVGWRGYALPRMAKCIGLGPASVLLGVIWGVWHWPFFYMPGVDQYGQSLLLFVIGVTAISVAMAWLYGNTQGSLLLTMLMHSAINQSVGLVSDILQPGEKPFALGGSLAFVLTGAWLWIAAAYCLVRMPSATTITSDIDAQNQLA